MPEFYVTVSVWVEADDEDAAREVVAEVLRSSFDTASFDTLDAEPVND